MSESEVKKTPIGNDPQDVAAMMFSTYHPRFEMLISTLSNNELRRVLQNIVMYPLADPPIKHVSNQEKEAFQVGYKLAQANQMMQMYTYGETLKQLEEAKKNEAPASEKVEEKND